MEREKLDSQKKDRGLFHFPRWANSLRPHLTAAIVLSPLYILALAYLAFSPQTTAVGYAPVQPLPYSHKLHAGEMGIDCRYCHVAVENTAHATVPSTSVCMNCHARIKADSELLRPVRAGFESDLPLRWVRVHDLPDYSYFNHGAHVSRGVGCESCHGRIDRMDVVRQQEGLNMAWCLGCHRGPEEHLRPLAEVTAMGYAPAEDRFEMGRRLRESRNINPSTDCSTCHR